MVGFARLRCKALKALAVAESSLSRMCWASEAKGQQGSGGGQRYFRSDMFRVLICLLFHRRHWQESSLTTMEGDFERVRYCAKCETIHLATDDWIEPKEETF